MSTTPSRLVPGLLVALVAALLGAAGCVALMALTVHGYGLAYLTAGALTGLAVAALKPASRALPYLAGLFTLLAGPVVHLAGTSLGLVVAYARNGSELGFGEALDDLLAYGLLKVWPMTQGFWVLAALTTFVLVRLKVTEMRRTAVQPAS
ncbi:hypothetical protein ACIBG7_37540 [Nonomuraea sp. NPDC050328]|uniref:hypothetical protein n=1 Tax=Nonomuraea sp. NPDC050328 TaxID=3364361 RepID=UPI00378E7181